MIRWWSWLLIKSLVWFDLGKWPRAEREVGSQLWCNARGGRETIHSFNPQFGRKSSPLGWSWPYYDFIPALNHLWNHSFLSEIVFNPRILSNRAFDLRWKRWKKMLPKRRKMKSRSERQDIKIMILIKICAPYSSSGLFVNLLTRGSTQWLHPHLSFKWFKNLQPEKNPRSKRRPARGCGGSGCLCTRGENWLALQVRPCFWAWCLC